jgi:tetratricopeptide (TPR) repeat protein
MDGLVPDEQEPMERLYWQRRYQEIVQRLEPVVMASPGNAEAHGWFALALAELEQDDERALEYAGRALKLTPDCGIALAAIGRVSRTRDKTQEAVDSYQAALHTGFPLTYAWRTLVWLYSDKLKDLNRAAAVVERAKRELPGHPDTLAAEANYLTASKEFDKALSTYSQVLTLRPDDVVSLHLRAQMRRNKGDYQGALSDLDLGLSVNPDYVQALSTRADLKLLYLNDSQGALTDSNRAIRVNPKHSKAWAVRGHYKEKARDYQGALADYDQALEISEEYVWVLNQRGLLKAECLNDPQGAISDYSRAVEVDPNYKWAWGNRGLANTILKNYQAAIRDLSQAIAIDNQYVWAFEKRAEVYAEANMPAEALVDRARAYQLEPKRRLQSTDADVKLLNDTAYDHFSTNLLPQLRQQGERFIEYWECYLLWGAKTNQGMYQGTSTYAHFGAAGAGYLCVTDKNVRIVSLGQLSKHFVKKRGLFSKLALAALRNYDFSKREEKDRSWVVPSHSIAGASTSEESIFLKTTSETWEVVPFYSDDLPAIQTALSMLKADRFRDLLDAPIPPPEPTRSPGGSSKDEVFDAVKKLKELHDMGAITEAEFSAKKAELLSRL